MKEFSELPRPIQCMIKVRMEQQGNSDTKNYNRSAHNGGFDWKETPEEFDFWNKVINYDQYNIFFDRYPHLKMQNNTNSDIDYSNPHWWRILEEGDEIYIVNTISTDGIRWPATIGAIIEVTKQDVNLIAREEVFICFNHNKSRTNFTYNMVKLHKKKNLNINNNDVSKSSKPIQQGIGSNGLNLPSRECKIATLRRLVGTTTCFGSSQTSIKCGVLAPFQHI